MYTPKTDTDARSALGSFCARNGTLAADPILRDLRDAEAEISRLTAALRAIADHVHCRWDDTPDGSGINGGFSVGVVEGHRCAAEIAKAAIVESDAERIARRLQRA